MMSKLWTPINQFLKDLTRFCNPSPKKIYVPEASVARWIWSFVDNLQARVAIDNQYRISWLVDDIGTLNRGSLFPKCKRDQFSSLWGSSTCTYLFALTVLNSLIVIAALSGQNRLWTPKYPQVKVYPWGVCTPNLGSIGAPWWPLWVSPKSPWFSVVKLPSTIPHPRGRFERSLWGTHMYPTTPYWYPYETVGVAQAVSRQWWFFEGQMYPQIYPISHGAIFFNFSLKPPKYL